MRLPMFLRRFLATCKECLDEKMVVVLVDTVKNLDGSESGFPVLRPCPVCCAAEATARAAREGYHY